MRADEDRSFSIGDYVVEREQPPLSRADDDAVQRFARLYYERWVDADADTINLSWFGYPALKCPLDLWMYQELLVRTRPDLVIETGTWGGGSALFLAMVLDRIGSGSVVSIDVVHREGLPRHPRIEYLTGSSTAPETVEAVRRTLGAGRAMVILDSDHSAAHVFDELNAYAPMVAPGDYLIVEDTNVNGHPVLPSFGPGPMEALERFLAVDDGFERDSRCERFLLTLNPRGYLRRRARQERARPT